MSNKITCSRCGRISRATKAKQWNVTMQQGRLIGYLCPDCQTPEENAEAEINDSITRYGMNAFGQVIGFPKMEGAAK